MQHSTPHAPRHHESAPLVQLIPATAEGDADRTLAAAAEPKVDTEASLCNELAQWCAEQQLECRSADELLSDEYEAAGRFPADDAARARIEWLSDYIDRWNAWEDAQRTADEKLSANTPTPEPRPPRSAIRVVIAGTAYQNTGYGLQWAPVHADGTIDEDEWGEVDFDRIDAAGSAQAHAALAALTAAEAASLPALQQAALDARGASNMLRVALTPATNVEALLLLPLIGDAARLEQAIVALINARITDGRGDA
jgi:hypothetical protein